MIQHNIYSESNYGLYEDLNVESLDPLNDPLRYNPFNDNFWDYPDDNEEDLPTNYMP